VRGEAAARFEGLVSEAATAAVDHLSRGYDVELVTRDRHLVFAGGPRQRLAVLETLALVQPVARRGEPLTSSDPQAPALRLSLEREAAA
jgi:ABC-type arginine transport system ATPase subunit